MSDTLPSCVTYGLLSSVGVLLIKIGVNFVLPIFSVEAFLMYCGCSGISFFVYSKKLHAYLPLIILLVSVTMNILTSFMDTSEFFFTKQTFIPNDNERVTYWGYGDLGEVDWEAIYNSSLGTFSTTTTN